MPTNIENPNEFVNKEWANMTTNDEIIDKHIGGIETKDGFVCETCGAKFRTDYELLAHQGNPVIYTQEDMEEARANERQKIQRLEKVLSEYLNLLEEDKKLFPLTLSGDDEPQPTKYMGDWIANTIKLKKSEEKLIKIFREYKAKGEKK